MRSRRLGLLAIASVGFLFFAFFHVRVAWGSRPPCSIVAGYACSHSFMVFNRVVSLLAVGLVIVGSLENIWLVGVFRLSCVWIEVHSSSTGFLNLGVATPLGVA